MTGIDPDLIGIWIRPGAPQTYEVLPDGSYHVADPEETLHFEADGAVMRWGDRQLIRRAGTGETPVGIWRDAEDGDVWQFSDDGSYEITVDQVTDRGIWALCDEGAALWTRELMAVLTTDGATLTYHMREGATVAYGYAVADGVWTLHDPNSWVQLARFVAPSHLAKTG